MIVLQDGVELAIGASLAVMSFPQSDALMAKIRRGAYHTQRRTQRALKRVRRLRSRENAVPTPYVVTSLGSSSEAYALDRY